MFGILYGCHEHAGLNFIHEVINSNMHSSLNTMISIIKALVPGFVAYFFLFISYKTTDFLYYSLYFLLISMIILLFIPEDQ